jgi:hypothetical protein
MVLFVARTMPLKSSKRASGKVEGLWTKFFKAGSEEADPILEGQR